MANVTRKFMPVVCVYRVVFVLSLGLLSGCTDDANSAITHTRLPENPSTEKLLVKMSSPPFEYSSVHRDPVNDSIIFLKGSNLSSALVNTPTFQETLQTDQPETIALAFLQAYSAFFKLANPNHEFNLKRVQQDDLGYKHVRLQQHYRNIPVLNAEIIVHLNTSNHIYLVNGHYIPTPTNTPIIAKISEAKAIELAVAALDPAIDCSLCTARLVIFSEDQGASKLAYQVHVAINIANAWQVMVDAIKGEVLTKTSTIHI